MTALLRGIIMPASLEASQEVRECTKVVMDSVSVTEPRKIKPEVPLNSAAGASSDRAVEAVSGVAEPRNDVAVLVEPLVQRAQHDRDLPSLGGLLHGL
jgi:hypothetical protein